MCEELVGIRHTCEELVRLFLGCEELVPIPHTCEEFVDKVWRVKNC